MAQYLSVSAVYGVRTCQSISCHCSRTTRMRSITDCTQTKHCHGSSDPSVVMKTWWYVVWLLYYRFNKSVLSTEDICDTFWKKHYCDGWLLSAYSPTKIQISYYILKNCFLETMRRERKRYFTCLCLLCHLGDLLGLTQSLRSRRGKWEKHILF